jgi:CDP-glycerol glycerophosphotransferase
MTESIGGEPQISIIVPVHGVEAYLETCIESIRSQARDTVEIFAVDDRSTDRCGAILDAYARRDPRVRVLHLPTNVGLSQARNIGIDHARGEYLWFVDGDDWLPAGAVQAVVERLALTEPDILIVDHAEVADEMAPLRPASGGAIAGVEGPIRVAQRPQLLRLAQSACTKIVRRSFLADLGLRFRPGWYEDCSFSRLLLLAAERIDVLDRVCYCYRQDRDGGITRTPSPRHFDVFDQYDALFATLDRKAGAYDEFRPELFRLMIDHYLVIVGHPRRVPDALRREFFSRMAEQYRRWLPAGGYSVPGGLTGLKHRLVRHDAYRTYLLLRYLYRTIGKLRRASSARGD